jgi:glucose/arabinose dehydrogenase
MRFTCIISAVFCLPVLVSGGLLPTNQFFQESSGFVVGEAEFYHGATTALGDTWTEISANAPGAMSNARGSGYMQALPDGDGTIKSFTTGASIEYRIHIQTPGTYRLWLRWDGVDDSSDSIYAGIVELAGAGGQADWYEAYNKLDANFSTDPWDGLGGSEQNQPIPSQNPMIWTIATSGVYTLKIAVREDGAALDTWILQLNSLPDPTGMGPLVAAPDSMLMHRLTKAGISVLKNDAGSPDPDAIEIVTPPSAGIATPQSDGRILYEHTTGFPSGDSFAYSIHDNTGQTSAPATVSITFSDDARIPNTTVAMPIAPPPTTFQVVDALPGVTFSAPTAMDTPPGDTNRLFVAQRNGLVYVITNVSAPNPQPHLFLNISSQVHNDNNELGMKGLTFHPGFATNHTFYVTYCHLSSSGRYVRLSSFRVFNNNIDVADTNSEVMLINQRNDDFYHNIDSLKFGPDSYLYIGIGDEGPQNDGNNNSQRIDKDIWSAILRIDPDKRPGNLPHNAHSGIPTNAFLIPSDNPFIGATQFNGIAVNPANVRTEFFAVGFRNPWQFSFDELNGDMWVADVGNDLWEEVSVIPPGGNGGWVFFEGTHNGPRGDKIPPPGFVWDRPVWDYPHGNGEFAGYSITGGFVYRGNQYPALYGKYICADYVSGNIWTIERTGSATNVVRITGEGGLVQFGFHPATREILMLDHGDGRVRKLTQQSTTNIFPATLSETGFFADLSDLSPNPGVLPYQPNLSFWSDYAIKQRWFVITNTTDDITYSRDGNWTFPPGMMWVKHFDLELDRGNPATKKRLETRVLVKTASGAYGVSYQWNTNGTEAMLVPDAGVDFNVSVTNQGVPVIQQWRIPSRAECLVCHTPSGGHALSFNTRQLNCPGSIAGQSGNLMNLLDAAGYMENAIDDPGTLPRHIRPDETEYSIEARSRSYLAVNCGYCHMGEQSIVPGNWDGRAYVKLDETGLLYGYASDNGGDTNNLLIVPSDVNHSIIWNRMAATNGFTRMPPLATSERDPANIQLIAEWIAGDLATRQAFSQWQIFHFGSTNNVDAAADADPDEDGRSNEEEFLTYTDPEDADSFWTGMFEEAENGLNVGHDLYNREVFIEFSTNLNEWSRWNVPQNNGLPIASGTTRLIPVPTNEAAGNFRFTVEDW